MFSKFLWQQSLVIRSLERSSRRCLQQYVRVTQTDGIREIQMIETKTRNALSMPMMMAISEELRRDCDSLDLRCIVLSAEGPVWSTGHNLKELVSTDDPEAQQEIFEKCTDVIKDIVQAPVPVIAKVDGLAAAAGCQLMASCDIVVCSDKSSFSTPGVNFGVFCSTPGVAIARRIPKVKASYLLMTGLPINAQEAYTAGLVSVVAAENCLDAELCRITDAIKLKSREVMRIGKEFFYQQIEMNTFEAYKCGAVVMKDNVNMVDGLEGICSFIEKRKPVWSHE